MYSEQKSTTRARAVHQSPVRHYRTFHIVCTENGNIKEGTQKVCTYIYVQNVALVDTTECETVKMGGLMYVRTMIGSLSSTLVQSQAIEVLPTLRLLARSQQLLLYPHCTPEQQLKLALHAHS